MRLRFAIDFPKTNEDASSIEGNYRLPLWTSALPFSEKHNSIIYFNLFRFLLRVERRIFRSNCYIVVEVLVNCLLGGFPPVILSIICGDDDSLFCFDGAFEVWGGGAFWRENKLARELVGEMIDGWRGDESWRGFDGEISMEVVMILRETQEIFRGSSRNLQEFSWNFKEICQSSN
jgi:hypothetical protein